jgi:hypothetical protein
MFPFAGANIDKRQWRRAVLEMRIAPLRERHHHRQEILASGREPVFIAGPAAGLAVGDPCDDLRRLQLFERARQRRR